MPAFYIFALSKKTNQIMKKFILLAALALPLLATAQSNFKFGINTGRNFSDLRDTGGLDYKYWFGYVAGVSGEVPLSEHFALNANLNYEAKRFRVKYTGYDFDPVVVGDELTATTTYHYLVLPLSLKYFISAKSNTLYILGGGYGAYQLGSRVALDDDENNKITKYVKKTDFGATLGIGYRLGLDEDNEINFELKDNLGLTGTRKGGDGYKINAISLMVNWQFAL